MESAKQLPPYSLPCILILSRKAFSAKAVRGVTVGYPPATACSSLSAAHKLRCAHFFSIQHSVHHIGRKKPHHHGGNAITKMPFLFSQRPGKHCQHTHELWYVLREIKVWTAAANNGWRHYITWSHFRISHSRNRPLTCKSSVECLKLPLHTSL